MIAILSEVFVLFLKSFYLLLPCFVANMSPVFFKNVRFLDYPIDFGKKWKGKPILGANKTFRGFFFGVVLSIIVAYIQLLLFRSVDFFREISLIDYSANSFIVIGFLLGFGALLGDSAESFLKRRAGIKPGNPWIPWDQMDVVIGALLFLAIIYIPRWDVLLVLLVTVPFLHILTNHIGYYLGINKNKW